MNIHGMFERLAVAVKRNNDLIEKMTFHSAMMRISCSTSVSSVITLSLTGDMGSPFWQVLSFGLSLKQTHAQTFQYIHIKACGHFGRSYHMSLK